MRYEGKEGMERLIEANREGAQLIPSIKKVVTRFDGKVYNIRLQKALQAEIRDNIYCQVRYSIIEIYTYYGNSYEQITLACVPLDKGLTDKRINADVFIDYLNEKRAELLKEAYEIEQGIPLIDTYKAQFEVLQEQINNLRESIPKRIRYNCGLDYRLKNY